MGKWLKKMLGLVVAVVIHLTWNRNQRVVHRIRSWQKYGTGANIYAMKLELTFKRLRSWRNFYKGGGGGGIWSEPARVPERARSTELIFILPGLARLAHLGAVHTSKLDRYELKAIWMNARIRTEIGLRSFYCILLNTKWTEIDLRSFQVGAIL